MNSEANGFFGQERVKPALRDQLSKYAAKWYIFVVSLIVCVGAGFFYIRYSIPKYAASTTFLIKGAEGGLPNSGDLVEQAINGRQTVNLNNEILLVRSVSLMERVVGKHGFNITYYKKGRIVTLNIFKEAPFRLTGLDILDSNINCLLYVKSFDSKGGVYSYGLEKEDKKYTFTWGQPIIINGQKFKLDLVQPQATSNGEYIVNWKPIHATAVDLASQIQARSVDTKTSVIELYITTDNLQFAKELLDATLVEFNAADIEDRNKLSENTVKFVNERLLAMSNELNDVEGNLEGYQGRTNLVDVKGQMGQYLENSDAASKALKDLGIQKRIADMVSEYVLNPANKNKLVPSSLGLDDATLGSLIAQYNDLQLVKEKEAANVTPLSTVSQNVNSRLDNLKGSIIESLSNINKNLKLREDNISVQNNQYRSLLASIPHSERVMQEIKRKQSITEGLYLYLLQKREEAAISSTAANLAHYRQIDYASGYGPVEPNKKNIYLYTTLLGLGLAFGIIHLKLMLNNKVLGKDDILKEVSAPLIGQISHVSKKNKNLISVLERNIQGEQFRLLRTNLSFSLKDKTKKVILISSCNSGEGKSFVSLNLAAVYAMPGKKVALLEFDIRKPSLGKQFSLENEKGLTDYLSGETKTLSKISHIVAELPGLHIYPAGAVSFNPADLLLNENMTYLIDELKLIYDFIIIDSPPVLLVSDGFILAEYCDITLFVVRQNVTNMKQISHIENISKSKKMKNVGVVFNDIRGAEKNSYYDYKYKQSEFPIKNNKAKSIS